MPVKTGHFHLRLRKFFSTRFGRELGEGWAWIRAGESLAPHCFLEQSSHQTGRYLLTICSLASVQKLTAIERLFLGFQNLVCLGQIETSNDPHVTAIMEDRHNL